MLEAVGRPLRNETSLTESRFVWLDQSVAPGVLKLTVSR